VQRNLKSALLTHVLKRDGVERTLVFTRTKHGADKVVRNLNNAGIRAEAIHGNKSQNARTRALAAFKSKTPPVLVATDIASRGIDVDGITHVINFDIPHEPETYVHRIGRTARAGASGVAISFCDAEERADLKAIERLTKLNITVKHDMPELAAPQPAPRPAPHAGGHHHGHRAGGHHKPGGQRHHSGAPGQRHRGQASHSGQKPVAHPPKKPQTFGQRGRGRGRAGSGRAW
jgi:ATP-dependent RNA helicase RhlE